MTIKIEQSNWSEASKRSFAYGGSFLYSGSDPDCYENVVCRCFKCEQSFVFTAKEQKIAFEVHKQYVWKPKRRCNQCQLKLENIQTRERELQLAWNKNGKVLCFDRNFLEEWLTILELIPLFGKRENSSAIRMLRKALLGGI
nr:hypothetical protein [uncultured Undibacterium sp.]